MQDNEKHVEQTQNEADRLIKTPQRLLITVALAFIIPIIAIILLVKFVTTTSPMGAGSPSEHDAGSIEDRIHPVAGFVIAMDDEGESDGTEVAAGDAKTGEEVYTSTCAACHSSGVAGAPVLGNNEEWGPLIETGYDALLKIAIEGKGAMPARGGNNNLSDLEVARAVVYMANESGASFDEPTDGSEPVAEEPAAEETTDQAQPEASDKTESQASDAQETEVEETEVEEVAAAGVDLEIGKKIYEQSCALCHSAGIAGAPKTGSKEDWQPYIDTGMEEMLAKAISGVGAMPPRGASTASDEELQAAIEYMIVDID